MTDRPNVLIIYPDQMRYDAMGSAGNPVIKTPNIDRLAMEGVHFAEAYLSFPICCPFRASMLTGKYAHGHGMVQNHFPLRGDQTFLAEVLREAGYRTGYIGKWHLEGGPKPGFVPPHRRFGFEHFIGFNRGHDYLQSIYFDDAGQAYAPKRYEPDYQTDQFIEFIDGAVVEGDGRPFFGYISYGPPHFPNNMPEHYRTLYRPEEVPLPPGVPNPELQVAVQRRRNEEFCGGDPRSPHRSHAAYDTKPPGEPETEAEIRQFIAEYYGMIANIDWNVGRVLNRLDALGIAENTLVVFLSDHGDMLGQHGYFCGIKCQGYRAAMQVPLNIRYPARFEAGRTTRALVDVGVDMMPTLLDLCGIEAPEGMHGQSYLPVLDGTASEARDAIMYQVMRQTGGQQGEFSPYAQRGIRTREWLYVRHRDRRVMLHDLRGDYHEQKNLVERAGHAALMDDFDARIAAHMAETGDDWDMAADFPPPDFLTHAEARVYLESELLPNAIVVT